MPYTPTLELMAAPTRVAAKATVPKKSSGEFQAAVDNATARAESSAPAKEAAEGPAPENQSARPVKEASETSETSEISASEPEAPPEQTAEVDNDDKGPELTVTVLMDPFGVGPLPGAEAALTNTGKGSEDALSLADVAGATKIDELPVELQLPFRGAPQKTSSASGLKTLAPAAVASALQTPEAALVENAEALKEMKAAGQLPSGAAPQIKEVPGVTGARPLEATGLQVQTVTPQSMGTSSVVNDSAQMLMNWVERPPEEPQVASLVTGSITPVELLDEAVGLETSQHVSQAEVEGLAPIEGENTETAAPTVNGSSAERPVADTAKVSTSPPAPRAEEVLPQILKHAEALKAQQQNSIKLQLYPEHLGKVEIKVMSHQGVLSAQLTADSLQVKGLLESQMVGLQRSLQEMGLRVDRVEVALSSSQSGGFEGSASSFADSSSQQRGQDTPQTRIASHLGAWTLTEGEAIPAASESEWPAGASSINAIA